VSRYLFESCTVSWKRYGTTPICFLGSGEGFSDRAIGRWGRSEITVVRMLASKAEWLWAIWGFELLVSSFRVLLRGTYCSVDTPGWEMIVDC
jgi:hypothetical protein